VSATTLIEAIKDDLGYLKLHRSAEIFAALADGDRRDDRLEFLAALVAEEAAATRQRRLNARLRFAHFPGRRTIDEFDFDFQPSIDPNVIRDLAGLGFVEPGPRSCCWASRAAARATWRSRWGSVLSRPATAATSPPLPTWSRR
jgi:DNA replication protein DnaC